MRAITKDLRKVAFYRLSAFLPDVKRTDYSVNVDAVKRARLARARGIYRRGWKVFSREK